MYEYLFNSNSIMTWRSSLLLRVSHILGKKNESCNAGFHSKYLKLQYKCATFSD